METTALCFQGTCRIYSCLSKCSLPFPARWLRRLRLFLFLPSPRASAAVPLPRQRVRISPRGWLEGCAGEPNCQQILRLHLKFSACRDGEGGAAGERRGRGKAARLSEVKRNGIFLSVVPRNPKRERQVVFFG